MDSSSIVQLHPTACTSQLSSFVYGTESGLLLLMVETAIAAAVLAVRVSRSFKAASVRRPSVCPSVHLLPVSLEPTGILYVYG